MANSLVALRVEESRKNEAIKICESIGIDLPTYLRICIFQLIKAKGIPFSMFMDETSKRAFDALDDAQKKAEINGTCNLTLDEINAEIEEVRKKKE